MSKRFEIADVLSEIDNFLENSGLNPKDPDLVLRFVDQFKKMEAWFICKVYFDSATFLHRIVDLCQNNSQNDVRKFMAFARYSFRQLGPERFEDCIKRSSLTSGEKGMIIGCFRIGEMDHALTRTIAKVAETRHKRNRTSMGDIISEAPETPNSVRFH